MLCWCLWILCVSGPMCARVFGLWCIAYETAMNIDYCQMCAVCIAYCTLAQPSHIAALPAQYYKRIFISFASVCVRVCSRTNDVPTKWYDQRTFHNWFLYFIMYKPKIMRHIAKIGRIWVTCTHMCMVFEYSVSLAHRAILAINSGPFSLRPHEIHWIDAIIVMFTNHSNAAYTARAWHRA